MLSVKKVSAAAKEGRLADSDKLGPILYRWLDWGPLTSEAVGFGCG